MLRDIRTGPLVYIAAALLARDHTAPWETFFWHWWLRRKGPALVPACWTESRRAPAMRSLLGMADFGSPAAISEAQRESGHPLCLELVHPARHVRDELFRIAPRGHSELETAVGRLVRVALITPADREVLLHAGPFTGKEGMSRFARAGIVLQALRGTAGYSSRLLRRPDVGPPARSPCSIAAAALVRPDA